MLVASIMTLSVVIFHILAGFFLHVGEGQTVARCYNESQPAGDTINENTIEQLYSYHTVLFIGLLSR